MNTTVRYYSRVGIQKLVRVKDIPVSSKNFHCQGEFSILHKSRPNNEDLKHTKI